MAEAPMSGGLSRRAGRRGDREAVLAAACNVLARHHRKVTGGSTPAGMPSGPWPSPDAGAAPGMAGSRP